MSHLDYEHSKRLSLLAHESPGNAFVSLLFALLREAGSEEFLALSRLFPRWTNEFRARYDAPGGLLPGEQEGQALPILLVIGGLIILGLAIAWLLTCANAAPGTGMC